MKELEEIRDRREVITAGPWKTWDRGIGFEVHDQHDEPINSGFRETFSRRDAEFIAHAPTDIVRLLDAVESVLERCEHMDRSKPVGDWYYNEIIGAIQRALGVKS